MNRDAAPINEGHQTREESEIVADTERFKFGLNWHEFVERYLTPESQERAKVSLADFLRVHCFEGKSFLDIGCGSGLFSLAAFRLGARRIVSFDIDPDSVKCCRRLWESAGSPANWTVLEGSILDPNFVSRIEPADVVYAWGCLHHTGAMQEAIRLAAHLVADGGKFYLAIYNRKEGARGSEFWLRIKRRYNRSSRPMQRVMEASYMVLNAFLLPLARLENPFAYVRRSSGGSRGMNLWIDLKDWLGGYPYEFASVDEIFHLCHDELGLELKNLKAVQTSGNNEFLFERPATSTGLLKGPCQ